ncbi:MAG: hypothetical protein ACLFVE_10085 [Chitinispirillaceae bacterium]
MKDSTKQIRRFAAKCRNRLILNRVSGTLLKLFSCFLFFSLVVNTLFSAYPYVALPMIWVCGAALFAASTAIIALIHLFKSPSLIQSAKTVENRSNLNHPSLSLALELSTQRPDGSESLKEQLYGKAAQEIEILRKVSFTPSRKRLSALTALLLCSTVISAHFLPQKIYSYWNLFSTVTGNEKTVVQPGSTTIPLNSSITLKLSSSAHYPSAKLDLYAPDGTTRNRHFLRPDSTGTFSFKLDSVKEDLNYQFSLASSLPPETISVAKPPLLRSLQVRLDPPRYTGRKSKELNLGQGNMTVYAGTEINYSIESSELDSAWLIFENDTFDFEVKGKRAQSDFKVWRSGTYTFRLKDTLNQYSDSLPYYMITIIPDEKPLARIVKPGKNKKLTTAQVETLWVEGVDDIGIRDIRLQWCRGGACDQQPQSWNLTEKGRPPAVRKRLVWDIKELSLYPGDTLFYWLRVRDNKPFGSPQVAVSDTFWFRIPSFEEIHKDIVKKEDYAQKKLGQVKKKQQSITNSVEKLLKSAVGTDELSWDQKRIMEDIQKQMDTQADSLQKALQSLKQSMDALKEDGKMNEELFRKMEKVKKTMEQLVKEFGENPLMKDQKQNLSMEEMRKAAGELQKMLPEMSERLDQTQQFLEMLKREKNISDLAMRAENLSEEQSRLAPSKETEQKNRRQKELLDRVDSLRKDVEKQFENEKSDKPSSQNLEELADEMKSRLNSGKTPSSQNMNAMSRELMSLGQQLKSRLASSMTARMEEDRKLLLGMAHDALSIEEWQQVLSRQAHGREDDSRIAKSQQALKDGLLRSLGRSDSLAMIPPDVVEEITESYRKAISRAQSVISSMSSSDGTFAMNRSVRELRRLAHLLLSLLSEANSSQSGSSGAGDMMSGLRDASGKQAALNSMMGELLQSMMGQGNKAGGSSQPGGQKPGGNQGGEGSKEARKQAQESQKAIAEELKRLADTYGKEAGENTEKRVRELEKEARRLARLMEKPPGDIIDQQDRFLSRMLQSTLSLNRKDEGKEERKGSRSETVFSGSEAPRLDSSIREADTFHLLRKKAFEDNYPEEYRSAIREYFDRLGELYLE